MELYDEDDLKKGKTGKKLVVALLIISVILLMVVGSIIMIVPRKRAEVKSTYNLNGEMNEKKELVLHLVPEGLFVKTESGLDYVDINEIAKIIGYEYYRGEYNNPYTEDSNKCYVLSQDEATSFILGSDLVYKTDPKNNLKYEYYKLENPVVSINNKLYASMDAIKVAFNSVIQKNEKKILKIYTLSYLYDYYENKFKESNGYTLSTMETVETEREVKQVQTEQKFRNKKALVYGMAVVNKNNKFGVISTSENSIIGTKYDNIDFVEERQEFIVTSGKKVGLLSNKGETKIDLDYDSLELLDGRDDYYLASQDSKFGIIKSDEDIVVPIEFDRIFYRIVNNKKIYYLQSGNQLKTMDDYFEET